jgi:hypothetical protein
LEIQREYQTTESKFYFEPQIRQIQWLNNIRTQPVNNLNRLKCKSKMEQLERDSQDRTNTQVGNDSLERIGYASNGKFKKNPNTNHVTNTLRHGNTNVFFRTREAKPDSDSQPPPLMGQKRLRNFFENGNEPDGGTQARFFPRKAQILSGNLIMTNASHKRNVLSNDFGASVRSPIETQKNFQRDWKSQRGIKGGNAEKIYTQENSRKVSWQEEGSGIGGGQN